MLLFIIQCLYEPKKHYLKIICTQDIVNIYFTIYLKKFKLIAKHDSALNLNSNKINNIVALVQNDGAKSGISKTKRWQNRKCLEVLERCQNALGNY